jgi:coenzyme PQQ precursor peptide PqqA
MEPKTANPSTSTSVWVKPTFEIIGVSLECTAYAAARDLED